MPQSFRGFWVQALLRSGTPSTPSEQAGIVAGVLERKTRRVRLDSRFRAFEELKALLAKLALGDSALLSTLSELRRRPRRAGKDL